MDNSVAGAIAAQAILKKAQPALEVDGKFGNYTYSVYMNAPAKLKGDVDQTLGNLGLTVDSLRAKFASYSQSAAKLSSGSSGLWVAEAEAKALVRRYCGVFGARELADKILGFLDIEATKTVKDGVKFYDARSRAPGGSYVGLFQMGSAAWSDAADFISRNGHPVKIGRFVDNATNPELNVAAGVAYAIVNSRALAKRGIPVTPNTLYGAHNQGVGGFTSYVKRGLLSAPKQSAVALRVLADARKEANSAVA